MLFENTAVTNSNVKYNYPGDNFSLKGKFTRHKRVAPKGKLSADTWRTIPRGTDGVELIYKKTLNIDAEMSAVINICTIKLHHGGRCYTRQKCWILNQLKEEVKIIYRETFPDDLVRLIGNAAEMIYDFFELKYQGKK